MGSKVIIEKNAYHDSVTLMSLSGKILELEGVEEAVVSMATQMNKDLLDHIGLLTDEAKEATDNDLVIAVKTESEERVEEVMDYINDQLYSKKSAKKNGEDKPLKTLNSALDAMPEANLAVISVPGQYAAREARQAIKKGLNVMIFSDNVSLEDEKEIKEKAKEAGLFVMGPDCGTAMLNQAGLCFANKVNKGNIGLVAASGTGLQEVMVQVDRLGYGISQAIGTGGRDLHESIGGIMMLAGLEALEQDENTEIIGLISKPPAESVQEKILTQVKKASKPVVICFIDGDATAVEQAGATFANTLTNAAKKLVESIDPSMTFKEEINSEQDKWITEQKSKLSSSQKYVRGLYCGGTLTSEALSILRPLTEGIKSNVAKKSDEKLVNLSTSQGHVLLDMGEDEFTVGKPHPMIDPTLRNSRIIQEAKDSETAVLLMDFELGYGSHDDPVGVTIDTIKEAQKLAEDDGRHLAIIGYICGTNKDKQSLQEQTALLRDAGVYIAESNESAVKMVAQLIS